MRQQCLYVLCSLFVDLAAKLFKAESSLGEFTRLMKVLVADSIRSCLRFV